MLFMCRVQGFSSGYLYNTLVPIRYPDWYRKIFGEPSSDYSSGQPQSRAHGQRNERIWNLILTKVTMLVITVITMMIDEKTGSLAYIPYSFNDAQGLSAAPVKATIWIRGSHGVKPCA